MIITPSTITSLLLLLLSFISSSTCHVFLPRTSDLISIRQPRYAGRKWGRQRDGRGWLSNNNRQSWQGVRGGEADAGYSQEETLFDEDTIIADEEEQETAAVTVDSLSTPAANNMVVLESSTNSATSITSSDPPMVEDDDTVGGETQTMDDDDEMVYATIGILNIPSSQQQHHHHYNTVILLSYKCHDDDQPDDRRINEHWGVTGVHKAASTQTQTNAKNLALAEASGCLCQGIVLNLSQQQIDIFKSTTDNNSSEELDDLLLCVAEGMIRRSEGMEQMQIPFSVTFEGRGDDDDDETNNNDTDFENTMENAKRYIQGYLESALSHIRELHFGKVPGAEHTYPRCQVAISLSDKSALDTATEMVQTVLDQTSEEVSRTNIVPRSLFGVLCKQALKEIIRSSSDGRYSSDDDRWNELISGEWGKLPFSESRDDTTMTEIETPAGEEEVGAVGGDSGDTTTTKKIISAQEEEEVIPAGGGEVDSSKDLTDTTTTGIPAREEEVDDDVRDSSQTKEIIPAREEAIISANEKVQADASETVPPPPIISADLRRKVLSAMAMAFVDAEQSLLEMETKMDDEAFLGSSDGEEDERDNNIPMPEFGSDTDAIVNAMSASLLAVLEEHDEPVSEADLAWVKAQRKEALQQVAGRGIHRLFHLHLQNLRDHFGRRYEAVLDRPSSSTADDQRQEAAKRAQTEFARAAFGSVPQICQQPEGELCREFGIKYSYLEALKGLLEDMYEATSTRGLDEEEWEAMGGGVGAEEGSIEDDVDSQIMLPSSSDSRIGLRQLVKKFKAKIQKRGPAKWYERLASKVFVIGINYIQGWIILQALRREARKRDLEMPKFPLF
mmetsp:Transcript_31098/g.57676  ORF Transcript_31098/g.57676 Transcript_31098/m.57676 type:complete len:843 (+) Transcript_31098:140-2668(+)